MEDVLTAIWIVLLSMLMFKDMSGKDELRRIREQLEKMNEGGTVEWGEDRQNKG